MASQKKPATPRKKPTLDDTHDSLTKAERIWQVVAAIPAGKVSSYGELAKRAGLPGYARYVGTTLSRLPEGSALPWFRVLNSQGKISFPAGSDAYREQEMRLKAEGVEVVDGKVNVQRFGWKIE